MIIEKQHEAGQPKPKRRFWRSSLGTLVSLSVGCILIAGLVRGVPAVVDYVRNAAVAAHQRSTTKELAAWSLEYSKISSEHDARRAMEMVRYIETYYVPSDGYRADPETEATLEAQRKKTIERLKSAVNEWSNHSPH